MGVLLAPDCLALLVVQELQGLERSGALHCGGPCTDPVPGESHSDQRCLLSFRLAILSNTWNELKSTSLLLVQNFAFRSHLGGESRNTMNFSSSGTRD